MEVNVEDCDRDDDDGSNNRNYEFCYDYCHNYDNYDLPYLRCSYHHCNIIMHVNGHDNQKTGSYNGDDLVKKIRSRRKGNKKRRKRMNLEIANSEK